jgi:LmbE family N-acetylglucosaminyl deacetylase
MRRELDFDDLRRVAIIAPHPDDESLGCGGLIARLRDAGRDVTLIFASDGAASHPGSRRFPPTALSRLREAEGRKAAGVLGVAGKDCVFLDLPDTSVPATRDDPRFVPTSRHLAQLLHLRAIDTLAVTAAEDPHCDHQASNALATAALRCLARPVAMLEYAVWAEAPWRATDDLWRIDIAAVRDRKRAAIACHRSQLTDLIDDARESFRLTPAMLSRFDSGTETFRVTVPR